MAMAKEQVMVEVMATASATSFPPAQTAPRRLSSIRNHCQLLIPNHERRELSVVFVGLSEGRCRTQEQNEEGFH